VDICAGHASSGQSLTERIIVTLRSGGLLNESVGASHLERNWPPALKESGAWPLSSMRQAFLNGALTRLLDPDTVLKEKIAEFVQRGEFGLASVQRQDGAFERIWFNQPVGTEEVLFDSQMFLLTKDRAKACNAPTGPEASATIAQQPTPSTATALGESTSKTVSPAPSNTAVPQRATTLRLQGSITPEVWNKLGVRLLPKLRNGQQLKLAVDFSCEMEKDEARTLESELKQALHDLGLANSIQITLD